jgi:hypothetical protein
MQACTKLSNMLSCCAGTCSVRRLSCVLLLMHLMACLVHVVHRAATTNRALQLLVQPLCQGAITQQWGVCCSTRLERTH